MTRLEVIVHGKPAGAAVGGRAGRATFSYFDEYLADPLSTPLSVSIPLVAGQHDVDSWLEGLLPDNLEVRREWRRKFGIKGSSAIAILASPVGHDCAGAVQFCSADEVGGLMGRGGSVDWLTEERLVTLIKSLRDHRTTWHGPESSNFGRFSLSGAQAKTAVVFSGGKYGIPMGAEPSTHIIKPTMNDPDLPDQALNEHVCLQTASNLGLLAVQTQIASFGPIQSIVISRFDRFAGADGQTARIHQEDMCQALGVHPDDKYQGDGGPSPQQIAESIRKHSSQPDSDAHRFLDALIYNWIIVGTDAHAKNYSFLLRGGTVRFAPLYDITSVLPYEPDWHSVNRTKLAMKIGKKYTVAKADRHSAWHETAESMGCDGEEAVARAEDMARQTPSALDQALQSLSAEFAGSEVIRKLADRIEYRASHCAGLSQMAGVPPLPPNSFDFDLPDQIKPIAPPPSAASTGRCQHIGVKSKKRCTRPPHGDQWHKY